MTCLHIMSSRWRPFTTAHSQPALLVSSAELQGAARRWSLPRSHGQPLVSPRRNSLFQATTQASGLAPTRDVARRVRLGRFMTANSRCGPCCVHYPAPSRASSASELAASELAASESLLAERQRGTPAKQHRVSGNSRSRLGQAMQALGSPRIRLMHALHCWGVHAAHCWSCFDT